MRPEAGRLYLTPPSKMPQEVTDAMLDERTERLYAQYRHERMVKDLDNSWIRSQGYKHATRAALEVERESLRLLEDCRDVMVENDIHGWAFKLTTHIQVLRTRLGINPE